MDFASIFKLAETTHGRNDSRPKRPTKIGRIDSPQNKAETTQAETTRPKRPTAETTRSHLTAIRNYQASLRYQNIDHCRKQAARMAR